MTVSGVDSGKLEVRELKAPKGYTAFEGARCVTVKAEGLNVDQVAAAKPKLTITAESPLRADSADGSTGSLEASLINTPTGTPPSITTGALCPRLAIWQCTPRRRSGRRSRAPRGRAPGQAGRWQP